MCTPPSASLAKSSLGTSPVNGGGWFVGLFAALLLALSPTASFAAGPQVFQFALQNGMQVVVIPDHRAPVVTQMIWFKTGGADDPQGLSGLAHFFEHMMFRGTKQVPGDRFSQTLARNGGEDNAFTTHDYTAFYEQIAKDKLPMAMALEADRMANLDLSDSNVATERQVVLEERRMRIDNDPQALLGEQIDAALFLSHPYGRPVIGWSEEVRRIGRTEAQDYYDHHYAPNNAILVVAGDVTADAVRADAQAAYAKTPARALMSHRFVAEPPRLAETRLAMTSAEAKVPLFMRSYRVPSYAEAAPGQAEALEVLAQLLGGDYSATLYRRLVEDRKLATAAGASYDGYRRDATGFTVYASPRPGVPFALVERTIDETLAAYLKPPNPKELARAKTQLVASNTYRRDSQYALASAYGQALAIGLTAFDVNAWPDRVQAVTGDWVAKAAREFLIKRESVTATLAPGK
ncbi:MAG: insulinase family protein [Alphaproteobacteria bacterium]|nr:insulinase family protein [Alphaproteobacteria bacterium]MBV9695025.1 insulinase family protein [Alphaproteobacteria bacterium]